MSEMENCPECKYKMVKHRSAGRGRYRPYPDLMVCPNCWIKFTKVEDKWMKVSRTGNLMKYG